MALILNQTIIFTFFLIFLAAWPVWGATYYVKNGGNDSLDGLSDATAWSTTSKVMATVKSGDIVYFHTQGTWESLPGGNYDSLVLLATAGVTYDGKTYGAGTKPRATFRATVKGGNYYSCMVAIKVSGVTIRGFDISGNNLYKAGGISVGIDADVSNTNIDDCVVHDIGDPVNFAWMYSIWIGANYTHTVTNTTIQNCEVYGSPNHEGIAIYPAWGTYNNKVEGVLIRNCYIHDNGTTGVAINNNSKNVIVEYCNITRNKTLGISIRVSPESEGPGNVLSAPTGMVIRYNVISNNVREGVAIANPRSLVMTGDFYGNVFIENGKENTANEGADFYIASGTTYTWVGCIFNVYNNTFYSISNPNTNMRGSVIIGYFSGDLTGLTVNFKNNIVYTGNYYPLVALKGVTLNHSNNLIYRSSGVAGIHVVTTTASYDRAGVKTWEASAQNTDPLFASLGTNFTLQSGSPAIDAGVSMGLTRDILGHPIPIGTAPDIGAFEYQPYPSSTTTTTPTTTVTGTTTTTTPTTTVTGTTTTTTPTTTTPTRIVKVKKRIFTR